MTDVRELFEHYAKLEGLDLEKNEEHGFYLSRITHIAWRDFEAGYEST